MTVVLVPRERFERWVSNFRGRHGPTQLVVVEGTLTGAGADGSTFEARLPLGQAYAGPPDAPAFGDAVRPLPDWGVMLVRKGGFAVARMARDRIADSKTGQRHVQGRTKAGGQSQQRFARRRDNQARQAYEAAAGHAARILGATELPVVMGGDHSAVDAVLSDPRLQRVAVVGPWLAVPDPRRGVLDQALLDGTSAVVSITDAEPS